MSLVLLFYLLLQCLITPPLLTRVSSLSFLLFRTILSPVTCGSPLKTALSLSNLVLLPWPLCSSLCLALVHYKLCHLDFFFSLGFLVIIFLAILFSMYGKSFHLRHSCYPIVHICLYLVLYLYRFKHKAIPQMYFPVCDLGASLHPRDSFNNVHLSHPLVEYRAMPRRECI